MALGMEVKIDVKLPTDAALSSAATQGLAKSMRLPAGAPVEVAVQGGTAVLRGVVATPHDRDLAEQLVLLEPGIARVTNELRVEPNGATLGKPQAPGSSGSPGSAVLPPR
jgi:osmotically-inducible protein OsmY